MESPSVETGAAAPTNQNATEVGFNARNDGLTQKKHVYRQYHAEVKFAHTIEKYVSIIIFHSQHAGHLQCLLEDLQTFMNGKSEKWLEDPTLPFFSNNTFENLRL